MQSYGFYSHSDKKKKEWDKPISVINNITNKKQTVYFNLFVQDEHGDKMQARLIIDIPKNTVKEVTYSMLPSTQTSPLTLISIFVTHEGFTLDLTDNNFGETYTICATGIEKTQQLTPK